MDGPATWCSLETSNFTLTFQIVDELLPLVSFEKCSWRQTLYKYKWRLFVLIGASSAWESAPGSFLFSLRNHDNLPPFKAPLKDENDIIVIYRSANSGPVFGYDLDICNNATSRRLSYTDFGDSFETPQGYAYKKTKTQSLLAGSYYFTPVEVEVLYI